MSSPYHEPSKLEGQPDQIDDAVRKEIGIQEAVVALPPLPVKDGGLRAWLQVVGCFLVFCNVW